MNNIKMPCGDTYCSNSSNNYYVCIPDVCALYFSYSTLIAFRHGGGLVISENCWNNTAGKHLNAIDPDKRKRLPRAEFEKAVDRFLTKIGLKGEQNV
jgi:hypothetical protein